jgi:hypothetical protein
MIIQNLRNTLQVEVKKKTKHSSVSETGASLNHQLTQSVTTTPQDPLIEDRSALLSSIKNKINRGFYNSDAVLEDLSHGFASALDQTV